VGAGIKPGIWLSVGFLGKVNEERKNCTNINMKNWWYCFKVTSVF
jgi:hypothetical protein